MRTPINTRSIEANNLIKYSGQVFTPLFLVRNMLDYLGYDTSPSILKKHIMENSCGDGAFLCEIVARYCRAFLAESSDLPLLSEELATYVHGIEIDRAAYENCIYNLDAVAAEYGLTDVKWHILNADALEVIEFDGRMDYVVGNPPYVRVHHLRASYGAVKNFSFAREGMTDLYLAFFELGLGMLNERGRLCYITPGSWLTSLAGAGLRRHICKNRYLTGLVDLGHFQAFDHTTAYTLISLFDNSRRSDVIEYAVYDSESHTNRPVDGIRYADMDIDGKFYLARRDELRLLRQLRSSVPGKRVRVKNGFATLADKVFISNIRFRDLTIPVLKASTGEWYRAFFPYDRSGKPLSKERIFASAEVADYLTANKETLLKERTEEECPAWYLYGRTQALKDVYADKYAINTIIKDLSSVKLIRVPSGSGLYSGLYIISEAPFEAIERHILSPDFIAYVKALKNYKSGGYYSFNANDLEQYLNYKLSTENHGTDSSDGKRSISRSDCSLV